jgi:TolA-binding protein
MKRVFMLSAFFSLLMNLPARAQDSGTTIPLPPSPPSNSAAAVAAKEDAEDRYERLETDLQAVQSDNEALHAKISAMETEIQTLRDAQSHAGDTSAIQDQLKQLADAIQQVDKKRQDDKDAISEEIRKSVGHLEQSLGSSPAEPAHASETRSTQVSDSPAAVNGYSYTIAKGDSLGAIVAAYNADYKSKGLKPITLRQAEEANPNVKWNRLHVGQKIIIPKPDGG